MEENNKYGEAMTKALPCGCIKKPKTTTLLEFKRILDKISHDEHLFVFKFIIKTIEHYFLMKFTPSPHIWKKPKRWKLLKDQHFN